MSVLVGLVVAAVYLSGFVFTYREAYVRFDDDMPARDPGDRVLNALPAMGAAAFWPVALVVYGLYRALTPVTARERQAAREARERHVRQLERELGIGDGS